MTLEEKLKDLKQQEKEIKKSIEEIENQIEEEKLKQLADGFSAYDLLCQLSKYDKYFPFDVDNSIAYEKAKEMIIYMRRNKND